MNCLRKYAITLTLILLSTYLVCLVTAVSCYNGITQVEIPIGVEPDGNDFNDDEMSDFCINITESSKIAITYSDNNMLCNDVSTTEKLLSAQMSELTQNIASNNGGGCNLAYISDKAAKDGVMRFTPSFFIYNF